MSHDIKTALYVVGGIVVVSVLYVLWTTRTRRATTVGTGAVSVPESVALTVASAVGVTPPPTGTNAPAAFGS